MDTLYIEQAIMEHPRVQRILKQFPAAERIICQHYGEVFNSNAQNFRVQKKNPALILAQKTGNKVLKTPEGFGIGGQQNYYFSHLLNCIYDCRYCFLQGMYNSANYVLFVNYEDFMAEIAEQARASAQPAYFFSGYDCDSLALEPVTHFLQEFLPFFDQHPNALLELRTKSANIRALLNYKAFDNCVVAFSFTPAVISQAVEHKVPALEKRIKALAKLADQGWKIGLRFDPLIYAHNFEEIYQELIKQIFSELESTAVHSVSIGPLRFPEKMFQKIVNLYPEEKLLAHPFEKRGNNRSYAATLEAEMKQCVTHCLKQYLDQAVIFECNNL